MLLSNLLEFIFAVLVDAIKNVDKQVAKDFKDFIIVFFNHHFHIKTSEFAQMSPCVGILGTKDWSRLKDSAKARTSGRHLLVQLRTHGKTGRLTKVVERKDIGSTFGCATNKLWCMNLDKVLANKVFAKQDAHHGFNAKNGLVCRSTQIEPAIVESHFLSNTNNSIFLYFYFVVFIIRTDIRLFSRLWTTGIFHLEWQGCLNLGDTTERCNLNLHHFLSSRFHWLLGYGNNTLYIDNRFGRNIINILDHFLWNILVFKANALN
mmetsp:Transcript_18662/g.33769  ORF Transcript_18662/g.33769 Transcript_18662/m.33769 type:complete len:263 (+) Transcript_18662:135-923(+)